MIIGSIKEDLSLEKRVSVTPESSKNIINLGLSVYLEKNYATHLGISDEIFKENGVKIFNSSREVIDNSNLITKVGCPSDEEISILKNKSILIGMLNPSKNQVKLKEILKKKCKYFFIRAIASYIKSPINGRPIISVKFSRI